MVKLTFGFVTRYVLAMFMAVTGVGSYLYMSKVTLARAHVDLMMPVDHAIPFIPWTVWLYLPLFVVVFHFAVWSIRDPKIYLRTMLSLFVAWACAFVFFFFFTANYPRPMVVDDGSLTSQMMIFLHTIDSPNNTFPSLHVADMGCVALGTYYDHKRRGLFALGLAALPVISILTVKQHFIADLAGGVLLAWLAHQVAAYVMAAWIVPTEQTSTALKHR